jgi:hypothetical protein
MKGRVYAPFRLNMNLILKICLIPILTKLLRTVAAMMYIVTRGRVIIYTKERLTIRIWSTTQIQGNLTFF